MQSNRIRSLFRRGLSRDRLATVEAYTASPAEGPWVLVFRGENVAADVGPFESRELAEAFIVDHGINYVAIPEAASVRP